MVTRKPKGKTTLRKKTLKKKSRSDPQESIDLDAIDPGWIRRRGVRDERPLPEVYERVEATAASDAPDGEENFSAEDNTPSAAPFVSATTSRLRVMRGGHNIIRSAAIPKPLVLVDTREQQPLQLRANHPNWIGGERRVALKTGDYTVEGMERLLALERKSLADLVACTVTYRWRFLETCGRLARFRWKAILVEATLEDIKEGFGTFDIPSDVHPNAVCGTLDAIEAKFGIPLIYTSAVQQLATERAASWLSKHFTYWWLEQQGYERVLIDTDGL